MNEFIVKVGPLNSLNSLYSFLGPAVSEIRSRFARGSYVDIKFDLTSLTFQKINIAALTTFLSTSRKMREAMGKPMELIFNWEPQVFAFLTDIGFFSLSKKLDIFYWDELMVGGFKAGVTNPNTKIIYFSDREAMTKSDGLFMEELIEYKSKLKQRIMPNFILRCSEILSGFDQSLVNTVTNSSIELIVNALVHGQDIAVVGLQRSSKRVTVSVSDGGIGFKKSVIKTFGSKLEEISQSQALLIGSLVQKKEHGLRLAIDEVLNFDETQYYGDFSFNEGWVIMSSFNCEIRWQKLNWAKAKVTFDNLGDDWYKLPPTEEFLGEPVSNLLDHDLESGYWKNHKIGLVGTRVTFEIPL